MIGKSVPKSSRVCSDHFTEDEITYKMRNKIIERHLNSGSVPKKEKQLRMDNKNYLIGYNPGNISLNSSSTTESMSGSLSAEIVEESFDLGLGKEFLSCDEVSSFPETKDISQPKENNQIFSMIGNKSSKANQESNFLEINSSEILDKLVSNSHVK